MYSLFGFCILFRPLLLHVPIHLKKTRGDDSMFSQHHTLLNIIRFRFRYLDRHPKCTVFSHSVKVPVHILWTFRCLVKNGIRLSFLMVPTPYTFRFILEPTPHFDFIAMLYHSFPFKPVCWLRFLFALKKYIAPNLIAPLKTSSCSISHWKCSHKKTICFTN